jgi:hypothetical protein
MLLHIQVLVECYYIYRCWWNVTTYTGAGGMLLHIHVYGVYMSLVLTIFNFVIPELLDVIPSKKRVCSQHF